MAFLRFSRDKRGYEHFYLVEATTRRGRSRNRILYWFRTPPGVKVGRLPFDDHVRRALEEQNPRVSFDWKKLLETPIPPPTPDVEHWRERRRAERAAKQAAALEAAAESAPEASEGERAEEELAGVQPEIAAAPAPVCEQGPSRVGVGPEPGPTPAAAGTRRRRRRRRGGGRGRGDAAQAPAAAADAPQKGAPLEGPVEDGTADDPVGD